MALKREGKLGHSRAAGFLLKSLMGKAWNSWKEHHERMRLARKARITYFADISVRSESCLVKIGSDPPPSPQAMGRMLHLRLAAAFSVWWDAVLASREAALVVEGVVARLLNRTLHQSWNTLRAHVEYRHRRRAADAHYLNTKGRLVFTAWRIGTKLGKALALWTGNTLRGG